MAGPAHNRATYEDLCAVPDTMIGEILDGELYTQARPSPPYANASSVAGGDLRSHSSS